MHASTDKIYTSTHKMHKMTTRSFTYNFCNTLYGLHDFTSCDLTNTFKRKENMKAIKFVGKKNNILEVFMKL